MAKVIVVGSGISGLLAACFAAKEGHEVKVLTYGAGALTVAGGIIDVFGYDENGQLITNPYEHIKTLKAPHPYALIGADNVEKALEAFKELTSSQGYSYVGDIRHNQIVPTAIGSFKPSCLIPPSISSEAIFSAQKLIVVGFDLLKDYFPHLIAKNLRHYFTNQQSEANKRKNVEVKVINLGWESGRKYRDVSALDIARFLETPEGRSTLISQLKGVVDQNTTLILPPVMGENPRTSAQIQLEIEAALNTKLVEVSSIPPSVTGLRLDSLLINAADKLGVDIIEKVKIVDFKAQKQAENKDPICHSLISGAIFGHEQEFEADYFIIATGGVFGGGLIAQMGYMNEPIFNLDINVPQDQKDWSHQYLFTGQAQPFASYGVSVNNKLQVLNADGSVRFANVFFVGRSLQGYDFCFEKSGNGVCVASAYHAAKQINALKDTIDNLRSTLSGEPIRVPRYPCDVEHNIGDNSQIGTCHCDHS